MFCLWVRGCLECDTRLHFTRALLPCSGHQFRSLKELRLWGRFGSIAYLGARQNFICVDGKCLASFENVVHFNKFGGQLVPVPKISPVRRHKTQPYSDPTQDAPVQHAAVRPRRREAELFSPLEKETCYTRRLFQAMWCSWHYAQAVQLQNSMHIVQSAILVGN